MTGERPEPEPAAPGGRLARALADAVELGDSHGDVDQAAKILSGAVGRAAASAAREVLARIDALPLTAADRTAGADALTPVAEVRTAPGGLDAGVSYP